MKASLKVLCIVAGVVGLGLVIASIQYSSTPVVRSERYVAPASCYANEPGSKLVREWNQVSKYRENFITPDQALASSDPDLYKAEHQGVMSVIDSPATQGYVSKSLPF